MNKYWKGRGFPWEYDPGPPRNTRWARLFAETPNYRRLGIEGSPGSRERFRWHFGPMFYRGRLRKNAVKVLVIGQEGAQDESLSHRSFTGGTGAKMQYFLNYLGITESYLFLNTFVYPIYGQYGTPLKWLAQDPRSPIVQHRHAILNYVLEVNDVHLVVAVGNAAKESVVTWIKARGGTCSAGIRDVSKCTARNLDPSTRIIGVLHPGGASKGGQTTAIVKDFKRAMATIREWMDEDPDWLPPDRSGARMFNEEYKYGSAPIPFRDFPYGIPLRLGRGGTSSNRMDQQRSIQIFSANGAYNGRKTKNGKLSSVPLVYDYKGEGSQEGYEEARGDVPYEPPKKKYSEFDGGPGKAFAQLLMGGEPGLEWPDFGALGATAHSSFGHGAIYRGRPAGAHVYVLADQQSNDDLFTGRALTGESGQRLQEFLRAIGMVKSYVIIRTVPIDTLDLDTATAMSIVLHPQVIKIHQAILDKIRSLNNGLKLILSCGPQSRELAGRLDLSGLPLVQLKAWNEQGALEDWRQKLQTIKRINYARDLAAPSFDYDGARAQIPRFDLPYGVPRWIGTSGDRASRPFDRSIQKASADYFKLYMPLWTSQLRPMPLSNTELYFLSTEI